MPRYCSGGAETGVSVKSRFECSIVGQVTANVVYENGLTGDNLELESFAAVTGDSERPLRKVQRGFTRGKQTNQH